MKVKVFKRASPICTPHALEDAECFRCGALITPATPLDREPFPPCKICQEEEGLIDGYCWDCDPLDEDFIGE